MIIDTNIIIAYLAGEREVVASIVDWRREGRVLFLSSIVETEVLSFSGWSSVELRTTEQFLEENFTSIPFDRSLARLAARVRRETKLKFPDAAIAATALSLRTPVITRNTNDFKKVSYIEILKL